MYDLAPDIEEKTEDIFNNEMGYSDDDLTNEIARYVMLWELVPRQRKLLNHLLDCYTISDYVEILAKKPRTKTTEGAVRKRHERAEARFYQRFNNTLKTLTKLKKGDTSLVKISAKKRHAMERLLNLFEESVKKYGQENKGSALAE